MKRIHIFYIVLLLFFLLFSQNVAASESTSSDVYLYSGIFLILLIMLWLGYQQESYALHVFTGFLFIVLGVYTFINGAGYNLEWLQPTNQSLITPGFTDWSSIGNGWVFYTSLILLALGLYYFIVVIFRNIDDIKEQKAMQEEEDF